MNILVVGANGQIGKHLVKLIQENGDQARALIRRQEQADYFKDLGAETAIVNLEGEVDAIAEAAEGVDAVVFTAGSGPKTGKDKTLMIDLDGAVKTIQAAQKSNVKRFIMISSFDTSREAIQAAPESFAPYVVAKHYADEWLLNTDLDYTIIHPGVLTNEPGTNQVTLGSSVERGEVPREDIAKVIYTSLKNDITIGKRFQVVGGQTPVEEAIQSVK
ncbi:SDR family oxidoreductase [Oceanobacillus sp. CFH 90083]|uniref:SDR family oxidoreductase n=1 Tax=Oceanobacillus sp. CFH 90083 TaxID=2592336 RepID=UPI00128BCE88|nr:SDR family oxidoreductase [Oceanobacillus sp. CFH 90083]